MKKPRGAGHGAALVEEVTPNLFTTSVANILPGQEIRIEITYLQPLPFDDGQYRFVFPMVVAPRLPHKMLRGDKVDLEVDLDAAVPLCGFDSPSHDITILSEKGTSAVRISMRHLQEIPNRDFILNYRVAGASFEQAMLYEPGRKGEPGTFLLLTTPPFKELSSPWPREVIFVLDRSGSMQGKSFDLARQAVTQMLDRLQPVDTFNVITASSNALTFSPVPLPAEDGHLRRVRSFVDDQRAEGETELFDPLRLAFTQSATDAQPRVRMVILFTNGAVTDGQKLLMKLQPLVNRARVFCFGIGTAVNRHLLNKLSAAGRGLVEYVFPGENIARIVDRMLRRISHAILTDIELKSEDGLAVELLPVKCPDVYSNRPLLILGRYRSESPPQLRLLGKLYDEQQQFAIQPPAPRRHEGGVPLAALWARLQIESLMDKLWLQPERKSEIRRQVIDLAIRYRLASAFTSFLVVEYRSAAERELARDAVAVKVLGIMPTDMEKESPPSPSATATSSTKSRLQHKLDRVRRPRVDIYYDEEVGGSSGRRVLPFVIGVLAALRGNLSSDPVELQERRFVDVDRDNFDLVLQGMWPGLRIQVNNFLNAESSEITVELSFRRFFDFTPAHVISQVEPLRLLFEVREKLRELLIDHPTAEFRSLLESAFEGLTGWLHERLSLLTDLSATAVLQQIDELLKCQLSEIIGHPQYRRLEGSWRGIHFLVMNAETSRMLKIRVLSASPEEFHADLSLNPAIEATTLYRRVTEEVYSPKDAEPFTVLLADYEFGLSNEDLVLLEFFAQIGARAFCPFITSASPQMFGQNSFMAFSESLHFEPVFDDMNRERWRSFLMASHSRFLASDAAPDPDNCCWMSAVYVWASRLADVLARFSWPVDISGQDAGLLPLLRFPFPGTAFCPSDLSVHEPQFDGEERDRVSDQLASHLKHVLSASRIMHYILRIASEKIQNQPITSEELEAILNRWLADYVLSDKAASNEMKTRYPLAAGTVHVRQISLPSHHYEISLALQPHDIPHDEAQIRWKAQVPPTTK